MAALITHDVVKEEQSVGAQSLTGDIATVQTPAQADSGRTEQPLAASSQPIVTTASHASEQVSKPENVEINGPPREAARSPFSKEALADASGGSDTDTSKPDTAAGKEDVGHGRTSSFKKPTTFKSVSVTKNFLAKANVPASSTPLGGKGK